MKAILVIDEMPKRCGDCILYQCGFCLKDFKRVHRDNEPPEMCPIKPMPEKMKVTKEIFIDYACLEKGYECGWNACIEEIEK